MTLKNDKQSTKDTDKSISDREEEEEKYEGRNWSRIFLAVIFVFIVTILWYVITAFVGEV